MGKIISFTDSIHIKETHKEITISIDKPSDIYEWLKEIKADYETDLCYVLYDLIRNEIESERERFWIGITWRERDK